MFWKEKKQVNNHQGETAYFNKFLEEKVIDFRYLKKDLMKIKSREKIEF